MIGNPTRDGDKKQAASDQRQISSPAISIPKGGGAIRGIDEKFSVNPVTGTGSLSVPIFTTPSRSNFHPQLSLAYDSGAGNGPFGLGWSLSIPSITRKTDKGLPRYQDAVDSDTFILSGAEDLVPSLIKSGDDWIREVPDNVPGSDEYTVQRYRPRIEGLFARIERWERKIDGDTHWRAVTKDNVTSIYGQSSNCRIADPEDDTRVFSWLLEESYDDRGNAIRYEYKAEDTQSVDLSAVQERNRTDITRSANRYLKRIKYGNKTPRQPNEDLAQRRDWLFEVVFDYGEHDSANPTPQEVQAWPVRPDAFSSYRASFEVRIYRLCQRVLMFHRFPDELDVDDCLVRATEFTYQPSPVASFITSVTQSGFVRQTDGTYRKKSLPPLTFTYSAVRLDDTIHVVDAESLENLPIGLDGARYQWVDLDGEGISGILTEQGDGWFYKPNLGSFRIDPTRLTVEHPPQPPTLQEPGPLRLARARLVAVQPSLSNLGGERQEIMDLAGDGTLDLVLLGPPIGGFYERTDGEWDVFTPFEFSPNVAWGDPNMRFIDLNGDGHADILVTEDQAFCWYPSKGEQGFGPAETATKAIDDEQGPALVFADASQSIYLADMSGDGLIDIARVRNGEVCYWPNLGYGRFGAKVTMDAPPAFDYPDAFSPNRIRLADIDGSGTTDIIYLGRDAVRIWFNQSGNQWSEPRRLTSFPPTDNVSSVMVVDLLGNGAACLVWSSPLPGANGQPMRYIDLMGGRKPHLMESITNNMGAETRLQYASSTKYYLEDLAAGRAWITRLPFPVHVVERVETREVVTGAKLVTLYRYHHGYFDGQEREFRGFGLVEQWDTESFGAFNGAGLFSEGPVSVGEELHAPPVYTKTWIHTGAFLDRQRISRHFEDEYYREPGLSDEAFRAMLLPDTILPPGLSADEERQACRALKGSLLRQEIYALDDSPQREHPYSVSERTYKLHVIQPMKDNPHAVFYAYPCETLDYHYERNPNDPRLVHQIALQVDEFGNVERSVAIGYPRRAVAGRKAEQADTHLTLTVNHFVNVADQPDWYRVGLPIETRTYEIVKPPPPDATAAPADVYSFEAMRALTKRPFPLDQHEPDASSTLPYEKWDWRKVSDTPSERLRLIEHLRTLYYRDDLSGPLPLGQADSLALPYESYRLAFTPGLLAGVFGSRVDDLLLSDEGKYVHSQRDANWWIPSGQSVYASDARSHFYLPAGIKDPFGNITTITYDRYDLLVRQTEDPLHNIVAAQNNYRTMQPELTTDPNGNRSAVRFDELGMVVAAAVMGKEGETNAAKMGDTLDDPTTRLEYDLFNWMDNGRPNFVHTLAREQHGPANPRWQESYTYSDGLGREAMTKIQAEPGPAPARDPATGELVIVDGAVQLVDTDPRWVGTGRTIFDNKGNPVKKYEPFFSSAHEYETERELVEWGITPVLHYDSLGRLIRTDLPNGTFSKVEFDAWQQTTYDENDTVRESRWYTDRGAPDPSAPEPTDAEMRAAWLAAKHANTPAVAHLDTLGRTFLTIADNGAAGQYETRVELDIEGNQRSVTDALGRKVMRYDYDILGNRTHQASMEAGEHWMLNDVIGKPIYAWDSRGFTRRMTYDVLRRPTELSVSDRLGNQWLAGRTVYGEGQGAAANHRGRVYQGFDGAGIVTNDSYDFKGNLLRGTRQLLQNYKDEVDWGQSPALENQIFTSSTTYDALNRPVTLTTPDNSVIRPAYNEANLLEQVNVDLRGAGTATPFVTNIDYNAKGQRERIEYGNNVVTMYEYDRETFRLIHIKTTRPAGLNGLASQLFANPTIVQDLHYTYDPVGNITNLTDNSIPAIQYNNENVEPNADYVYDAIYRLIAAHGREHIGQTAFDFAPADGIYRDYPFVGLRASPNDPKAVRNYAENYDYDPVGNFNSVQHSATSGSWTRTYTYTEPSLLEPGNYNNRLTRTDVGNAPETYSYKDTQGQNVHGCMTSINSMQMAWDFKDQLHQVDLGGGGTAYYVYDAAGQRMRKVIHRRNGTKQKERIYLGGFEIYREYNGSRGTTPTLERETLHIMDDQRRIALVETKTVDADAPPFTPTPLTRYQLGNHLGSASLELDAAGEIISYEEYYPYGSTSYQAVRSAVEVSPKRYRYTSKERDEESGLYYYGARYYAPWLVRWVSCDPAGMVDGTNLYVAFAGNPVSFVDPTGAITEKDLKNAGLAAAGSTYGFGKTLFNAFVSIGKVTYYSTAWALYQATGDSAYIKQAKTYERGMEDLTQVVNAVRDYGPKAIAEAYISNADMRFHAALEANDPFKAGEVIGQVGADAYMLTKTVQGIAGGLPKVTITSTPARATASGIVIGGGTRVVITAGQLGPALPPTITLAASVGSNLGGGGSGEGGGGSESGGGGPTKPNAPLKIGDPKIIKGAGLKGKLYGVLEMGPNTDPRIVLGPDELERLSHQTFATEELGRVSEEGIRRFRTISSPADPSGRAQLVLEALDSKNPFASPAEAEAIEEALKRVGLWGKGSDIQMGSGSWKYLKPK